MSLPRQRCVEAAERWGTPLYVTDLDAAAAAAHAWRDALPGALVAYAVKANPDPALLRRLADEGFGFEVVGPIELALALRAGGTPERIVVNGVGQTDADLARCAGHRRARQRRVARRARRADLRPAARGRIGLRINPGLDADTHPHLATGSADAKFGIALDELPAALERLRSAGIHLARSARTSARPSPIRSRSGGSPGSSPALADEAGCRAHRPRAAASPDRPAAWASAIRPHLPDPARLIVEPGRSIVGDARAGCSRASSASRRAAT